MEQWRDIPYIPGYRVSDKGNIVGPKGPRKLSVQSGGYLYFGVHTNGKLVNYLVHRVVACAFCEKPTTEEVLIVTHRDGNQTNNCATNLEWGTYKKNCADRRLHGTDKNMPRGEAHYRTRLRDLDVHNIRQKHKEGSSLTELARTYQVGLTTIKYIVDRVTWKHI